MEVGWVDCPKHEWYRKKSSTPHWSLQSAACMHYLIVKAVQVKSTFGKIYLPKNFQKSFQSWEGVHRSEPKCHLDPKSNLFISGGGGGTLN